MADRGQSENQDRMEQDSRGFGSINNPQQNDTEAGGEDDSSERRTSNRGFAAMDREKQKRIASEGGRAAHRQGVAHEWSRDEAREAGRKGGQIVSQNREHMSEIGRKGGQSSGQRRQRGSNNESEA